MTWLRDEPTTSQYENRHSTNRATQTGWENNTVYCFHPKYWDRHARANNADPDQTTQIKLPLKGSLIWIYTICHSKNFFLYKITWSSGIYHNLLCSICLYSDSVNQQWWVWSKWHVHRLTWAIHYENMLIQIYWKFYHQKKKKKKKKMKICR